MSNEMKFIRKLLAIALIGLAISAYGHHVQNETIKSAHLVSVNENTHDEYVIAFGDDQSIYSGDWKEVYRD